MLPMEPPSRASTVIASRMNGIDSWMSATRISTSSTPPPHSAAKSAGQRAGDRGEHHRGHADDHRRAGTVDDPHEHVAAEVIRAEGLLADAALQPGRWPQRLGQLLPVGIAGDHERPDQAHGEPRHDQRQPEAGGAVPGEGADDQAEPRRPAAGGTRSRAADVVPLCATLLTSLPRPAREVLNPGGSSGSGRRRASRSGD